jgi:hypothetical protein
MIDDPGGGEPRASRGFRARKREDHALALIEELRANLGDLSRAKRVLRELGRFYDPILGGSIMDVRHQREILEALEAGRAEDALGVIKARYELYIKDRAHLGKGQTEES